ncbi:hypothetical protein Nepgr_011472 [Nepenthes gracilis]|uniref:Late embryogenesis abundant protein LEA-2 subgroup domain-containing protein n=1 Tax=Nepenthes gracilis TaxID=150966 RepID=A0AAD3XMF2_NEPGR|nr:hypothetical protein Nepgr_011472 [Nepenthes gracilis]
MIKPVIGPQKTTHPLIWCAAVICTVFTVVVIITGVIVFVGYLVIRPKVPFVRVISAHLDSFSFYETGMLSTGFTIVIRAQNDNEKAHASFSGFRYALSFHGLDVARLEAMSFDVGKNRSVDMKYSFTSAPVPLDSEHLNEADLSLKENLIAFDLKGSTRARWRIGFLGSVNFYCHLNCHLFFQRNGNITHNSRCSSKSK